MVVGLLVMRLFGSRALGEYRLLSVAAGGAIVSAFGPTAVEVWMRGPWRRPMPEATAWHWGAIAKFAALALLAEGLRWARLRRERAALRVRS